VYAVIWGAPPKEDPSLTAHTTRFRNGSDRRKVQPPPRATWWLDLTTATMR
jgi:hypothetical protein